MAGHEYTGADGSEDGDHDTDGSDNNADDADGMYDDHFDDDNNRDSHDDCGDSYYDNNKVIPRTAKQTLAVKIHNPSKYVHTFHPVMSSKARH